MSKLYAINRASGENEPVANLSEEDSAKISRGYEAGYSFGVVTDLDTGKRFEIRQASCGGDSCNCAVTAVEMAA